MKVTTTITVEREIEVTFDYYPGCPGQRDSFGGKAGAGPPLEPDEPPSLEFACSNSSIDLTEEELVRAEQDAWEKLHDEVDRRCYGE